jgi:predicted nucleic acid-binding protein
VIAPSVKNALSPRVEENTVNVRAEGSLIVSAPVYVELSAHPLASRGDIDKLLEEAALIDYHLDEAIGEKERQASRLMFSKGGGPAKALGSECFPTSLIAAHTLLRADRLMTLDLTRYQQDFPELRLV